MRPPPSTHLTSIDQLREVMSALRAPDGCPWDREQDHRSLRWHAVEEVYELLDAIDDGDDHEIIEELGDLLLQVVFHAQLGSERQAFDFDTVCRVLVEKLVRRHPHVFGEIAVTSIGEVWTNWEKIKREEKAGSKHERRSALDGIPRKLPALMYAHKLVKKARKAALMPASDALPAPAGPPAEDEAGVASELFRLAALCEARGWSAENLLRSEARRLEASLRQAEAAAAPNPKRPRKSNRVPGQASGK